MAQARSLSYEAEYITQRLLQRWLQNVKQNYQLLPYQRSTELLRDLFDVSISKGTLYNISEQAYDHLEDFECQLKQYLMEQDLLHSDETGMNVEGKTHWLHTTSNEQPIIMSTPREDMRR